MARKLIITIPEGVGQYEHDIRRFVDAMVYKLNLHKGKGRWEDADLSEILRLLKLEVKELEDAIKQNNIIEVTLEGADVGNFALIAVAIAIERGFNADRNGRPPKHRNKVGYHKNNKQAKRYRP